MTCPMIVAATGAAFLLLALHPFVTYPLMLRLLAHLRPVKIQPIPRAHGPTVAVCVCAYNEAAVIAGRIQNLLAMRLALPDLRILVYVDGATDATASILRGFDNEITAIIADRRLGKTHGMNTLASLADADILVFTDANVTFAPDALPRLIAPFADPAVGCVCGHLRYRDDRGETAAAGSLYWRLEERIKALESATGSVIGADGSIFAIRRTLHRPPPPDLIDDMFISLSILCAGARVVRAGDALAFESAVSTPAEEFHRKVRIACQAFNVHRALSPALRGLPLIDQFKYLSHKLLRWLSVFLFTAAAMLFTVSLAMAGAWATLGVLTALTTFATAVVMLSRDGIPARIRIIAASLIATGIGIAQSLRGKKFQTWTPPASARALPALLPGEA
jgi:cellulose synthase/poly-beta-1,6-N-acetylglucosamine synthase-like glycosyltransferase